MSGIHIYNRQTETHSNDKNNFRMFRPYPLSNPYTHIKDKETKAKFVMKSREEAVEAYARYFDSMYGGNIKFTQEVNKIYERFKNGEDVYLECYCYPQPCHCDIIKDRLTKKLIKEKLRERQILRN